VQQVCFTEFAAAVVIAYEDHKQFVHIQYNPSLGILAWFGLTACTLHVWCMRWPECEAWFGPHHLPRIWFIYSCSVYLMYCILDTCYSIVPDLCKVYRSGNRMMTVYYYCALDIFSINIILCMSHCYCWIQDVNFAAAFIGWARLVSNCWNVIIFSAYWKKHWILFQLKLDYAAVVIILTKWCLCGNVQFMFLR